MAWPKVGGSPQSSEAAAITIAVLAFNDSQVRERKIPAGEIFSTLMERRLWYCRRSNVVTPGTTVLFYQSRVGFRGFAKIGAVGELRVQDRELLRSLGLPFLTVYLSLSEVTIFATPVSMQPLVDQLDFVTNKKRWGHSVRFTPRQMSSKDFKVLVNTATFESS
jgi:hypothetical protein